MSYDQVINFWYLEGYAYHEEENTGRS